MADVSRAMVFEGAGHVVIPGVDAGRGPSSTSWHDRHRLASRSRCTAKRSYSNEMSNIALPMIFAEKCGAMLMLCRPRLSMRMSR